MKLSVLLILLLFTQMPLVAQNKVLQLDGVDDYVELPTQIFENLNNTTIEMWVKWHHTSYFSQPFGFGREWNALIINNEQHRNHLRFFAYNNQELHIISIQRIITLNEWVHIAVVTGKVGMKLYLNGIMVGSNTYNGSFASIANEQNTAYLGKSQWADNDYFNGQIDEVRVWNTERSEAQIQALMYKTLRGNESGLEALYNFEDGTARNLAKPALSGKIKNGALCIVQPLPQLVPQPLALSGNVSDFRGKPVRNAKIFATLPWMATDMGLVGYDGNATTVIDTRDGLLTNNLSDIMIDSEGEIYVGGSEGLVCYKPNMVKPKLNINQVYTYSTYNVFDQPINAYENVPIAIEMSFDDFKTVDEKKQYQYRIIEIDTAWQAPTFNHTLELFIRSQGKYTIELRCIDRDLNYSETETIQLVVKKRWYKVPVVALLVVAVIILIFWLIYKYIVERTNANKLRARMLESEKQKNSALEKMATQTKITNKWLKQNVNQLNELQKFKETIIHTIVHDMKNPLNLIARNSINNETQLAVQKMQLLIYNMLNVQKLEEAQLKLNIEDVPFDEIMTEVHQQTQYLINEKNILFSITSQYKISLKVDKDLMSRVLINIIVNAIKFTPNNGQIVVSVSKDNNMAKIEVTDNGMGITEDFLPRIFDKYAHMENKKTSNQYSTGLGLTFCKMAVEAHGGSICVQSKVNQGTVFTIQLPVIQITNAEPTKTETLRAVPKLSESEQNELKEILAQLNQLKVYEVTEIHKIVEKINKQISENVVLWCDELKSAVKNCNSQLYLQLISNN